MIGTESVFAELLQGARDERERQVINSYWSSIPHANTVHALIQAGIYASEKRLVAKGIGLIDASIIVAAKASQASIWTLDKRLKAHLESEEASMVYLGWHDEESPKS